jgi:hypothetical protein
VDDGRFLPIRNSAWYPPQTRPAAGRDPLVACAAPRQEVRNLGRAPTYTLNRNRLVDQPGGERSLAETLGATASPERVQCHPEPSCRQPRTGVPAGSWRAPIDAGLANASDTSHISDVLDSHPILSDLTAAIAPCGTKGRR